MDARIRLVGRDVGAQLNDLESWLGREDEFRGRVSIEQQPIAPDEMGAVSDVLIVALGSGGAGSALVTTLIVWINHRKPKVDIEITRGRNRSVKIAAQNLPEEQVVKLLREALED